MRRELTEVLLRVAVRGTPTRAVRCGDLLVVDRIIERAVQAVRGDAPDVLISQGRENRFHVRRLEMRYKRFDEIDAVL